MDILENSGIWEVDCNNGLIEVTFEIDTCQLETQDLIDIAENYIDTEGLSYEEIIEKLAPELADSFVQNNFELEKNIIISGISIKNSNEDKITETFLCDDIRNTIPVANKNRHKDAVSSAMTHFQFYVNQTNEEIEVVLRLKPTEVLELLRKSLMGSSSFRELLHEKYKPSKDPSLLDQVMDHAKAYLADDPITDDEMLLDIINNMVFKLDRSCLDHSVFFSQIINEDGYVDGTAKPETIKNETEEPEHIIIQGSEEICNVSDLAEYSGIHSISVGFSDEYAPMGASKFMLFSLDTSILSKQDLINHPVLHSVFLRDHLVNMPYGEIVETLIKLFSLAKLFEFSAKGGSSNAIYDMDYQAEHLPSGLDLAYEDQGTSYRDISLTWELDDILKIEENSGTIYFETLLSGSHGFDINTDVVTKEKMLSFLSNYSYSDVVETDGYGLVLSDVLMVLAKENMRTEDEVKLSGIEYTTSSIFLPLEDLDSYLLNISLSN